MSKLVSIVLLAVFVVVLTAADTATTTTTTMAPTDNGSFESSDSSSQMPTVTPNPHIKEDNDRYNHKFAPYMGFMIAVLVLIFAVAGFIPYSKKATEGTEYNPMA